MKDLTVFTSIENDLRLDGSYLKHSTFDNASRVLYTCDSLMLYGVDTNDGKVTFRFDLVEAKCSDAESNRIVAMQYLTEMNSVFLANAKGDLMVLNLFDEQVECVGCIVDGISAAEWSPDQELLVIVSETNNHLLMSKEFNLITEQPLNNEEFGEAKFINVGWGKKETQFHGTEGKEAAKRVAKATEPFYEWDDLKPRISWRTDAEFYLVHSVDKSRSVRKFQVFTREGVLHSTSENVASMESAIAWKNSKALITSAAHKANKHEIVFYERNGLLHGGFSLPFAPKEFKVMDICWNIDSTVLCVWLERVASSSSNEMQSLVQLWTVGNYHWYLKHSIGFNSENKITSVLWDPEFSLQLHVITAGGNYIKRLFGWKIHTSNAVADYNGSVAVINGSDLLMTHFSEAVIPPPLCAYKVHCDSMVNNIVWSPCNLDFIVHLMNGDLVYYKYQLVESLDAKKLEIVAAKDFQPNKYKVHLMVSKFRVPNASNIQHVSWTDENSLAIVKLERHESVLCIYSMKLSAEKNMSLETKKEIRLDSQILNVAFNPKSKTLALQTINGEIFKCHDGNFSKWTFEHTSARFPQPCAYFSICSVHGHTETELCVGLTDFYRLYINNKEVANNCTSFYIHDKYILLSTHDNILKFIDMTKIDSPHIEELFRRLERGSKIVTCLHNDTTCILQMPRGNLETVHPRTLVITKLKENISNLKYKETIDIMRKHRINMNLIYDHNPKQFLENIKAFIEQIDNVNLLNLFITELSNEDVTKDLYRHMYEESNSSEPKKQDANGQKISQICEELIAMFETLNSTRYFLSILSCHAKKGDLDEALKKVIKAKAVSDHLVDEGLRHLLYLVDVNRLFDIALGTYDFDIVIMVAEKSQKDPKEYLPFLNELQKLEENYRKYKIDLHLKRYKKALASIMKCDESHYDELLNLVNEQKLHADALNHFKPDDAMFKEISRNFAGYLSNKKYYKEAGLILLRAKLYEEALEAFDKANEWRMYLCVCSQLGLKPGEFNQKVEKLVGNLKENNKHLEAAVVFEQYLNDFESAIESLTNGSHWSEAIRLIYKYNRFDFLETNLLPAIKANQQEYLSEIKTHSKNLLTFKERLLQVRVEKAEKHYKEQMEFDNDLPDNDEMSQMSSVIDGQSTTSGSVKSVATSINSQFSGKSTKNKNKLKKKGVSLKKGSANEDLAIVQELSDLITLVYNMQEPVVSLIQTMLLYNMDELCNNLQNEYDQLLTLVEKNLPTIWTNLTPIDSETAPYSSTLKPNETDFNKLDVKYRYPPRFTISKSSWKLHLKE